MAIWRPPEATRSELSASEVTTLWHYTNLFIIIINQQILIIMYDQVYQPDVELGHWVTGSVGHSGHLSRPGHRVIILTRCETRVFPVSEKKAQDKGIKIDIFFCENPSNRH